MINDYVLVKYWKRLKKQQALKNLIILSDTDENFQDYITLKKL